MKDRKNKKTATDPIDDLSADARSDGGASGGQPAAMDDTDTDAGAGAHGGALLEPPEEAVRRLEAELEGMKDRHLRVVAEYDNFRKRTSRERTETWKRAQADVVSQLLDALDDLGRVADLDAKTTSAGDVIQGVELVERKLVRELESAGLERVGELGESFDPHIHEAVGSLPAESPEHDHTVGSVLQTGYRFGGTLLRPARVQVKLWQGHGGQED